MPVRGGGKHGFDAKWVSAGARNSPVRREVLEFLEKGILTTQIIGTNSMHLERFQIPASRGLPSRWKSAQGSSYARSRGYAWLHRRTRCTILSPARHIWMPRIHHQSQKMKIFQPLVVSVAGWPGMTKEFRVQLGSPFYGSPFEGQRATQSLTVCRRRPKHAAILSPPRGNRGGVIPRIWRSCDPFLLSSSAPLFLYSFLLRCVIGRGIVLFL